MVSSVCVEFVSDDNVDCSISKEGSKVFETECWLMIALRVREEAIFGVKVECPRHGQPNLYSGELGKQGHHRNL